MCVAVNTDALIVKRFAELDVQIKSLRRSAEDEYDTVAWQQWATSAWHILHAAFGEASPHYQNFAAAYAKCSGHVWQVDALKGIFSQPRQTTRADTRSRCRL